MSRSRKKEAVYKDPNNTMGKKHANRSLRRRVKESIHRDEEIMPLLDEVLNSRNFLDFKTKTKRDDEDEYERAIRK